MPQGLKAHKESSNKIQDMCNIHERMCNIVEKM